MTVPRPEELLAEALGLASSQISEETGIATCESWDSLAHFRVIAALEEAIERPLSAEEIFLATDYTNVERLLSNEGRAK